MNTSEIKRKPRTTMSPDVSVKTLHIGTVQDGKDGQPWIVKAVGRGGAKRWCRYKRGKTTPGSIEGFLQAAASESKAGAVSGLTWLNQLVASNGSPKYLTVLG